MFWHQHDERKIERERYFLPTLLVSSSVICGHANLSPIELLNSRRWTTGYDPTCNMWNEFSYGNFNFQKHIFTTPPSMPLISRSFLLMTFSLCFYIGRLYFQWVFMLTLISMSSLLMSLILKSLLSIILLLISFLSTSLMDLLRLRYMIHHNRQPQQLPPHPFVREILWAEDGSFFIFVRTRFDPTWASSVV